MFLQSFVKIGLSRPRNVPCKHKKFCDQNYVHSVINDGFFYDLTRNNSIIALYDTYSEELIDFMNDVNKCKYILIFTKLLQIKEWKCY
jgi:hypothetical protein